MARVEQLSRSQPAPVVRLRSGLRRSSVPYLFALPALAIYAAFVLFPVARSAMFSFTSWNGVAPTFAWVGFDNYVHFFTEDSVARLAIRNTAVWSAITIVIPTALGLGLALALNDAFRGRTLLRTVFYAPGVLPLVAVGTIWGWLYNPEGFVNKFLQAVGLDGLVHDWLGETATALPATTIAAIWVRTGFPMLLYLAALQGIPRALYESAHTDGANLWQRFRFITMPSLMAAHGVVVALTVIDSFKVFDLVYAMTYGGPGRSTQVLGTWMYFNSFQYYKAGYGASIAVVVTVAAVLAGLPYVLSQTRK